MTLFTRLDLEQRERQMLAPYASLSATATREHPETPDHFRTAFERDRARIIHSKSFRRLKGKTQVFIAHHGDHYRNRLSHTLEVAQISRDLARNLGLNEDLAESIALAHDLGHTPFGHVGERKLDELLRPFGARFEHNQQSRRLLTQLEKKYPDFDGLNLTRELLDGLAKHQTPHDQAGSSFRHSPSLEAQVVNLADEIAYTNHDIDDGLRAGIFTRQDLQGIRLWEAALTQVDASLPDEPFSHRAVSALIHAMTTDLLAATQANLTTHGIDSLAAVYAHSQPLVAFSSDLLVDLTELRRFLFQHFYLAPSVKTRSETGAALIERIFALVCQKPEILPAEFTTRLRLDPLHMVAADFVAGMTDGYAESFLQGQKAI